MAKGSFIKIGTWKEYSIYCSKAYDKPIWHLCAIGNDFSEMFLRTPYRRSRYLALKDTLEMEWKISNHVAKKIAEAV